MSPRETMRGLWLEEGDVRLRRDLPVPEPVDGEARIRVLAAGICNTDLELIRGYYPFAGVLGHEFVGVVDAGPPELVGARVVGEINAVCRRCGECRAGRPNHCVDRTVLGIADRDGAFAEFLTLPVENLHRVPDSVPDEVATFTEPLAAALRVREQVPVAPKDRVLVVGGGKLGLLVARTLALTGCELTVVDRHPENLALLADGRIRTVVDGEDPEPERCSYDLAVEATGDAGGFATALRALRPRGTLVMKSTYAGELSLDASGLVVDEVTLVGSRCGPFPPALRLLEDGELDPRPMIHGRYPLAEAEDALDRARERGVLKVLITTGAMADRRPDADLRDVDSPHGRG